ncbi:hypothetical protein QE152_g38798 [Popillia japonica]|uniref:Uncharacterized protein n=1 Tax=Popillia japonica TaxID=7064 RepID=A0AAW1HVR7_POPJA
MPRKRRGWPTLKRLDIRRLPKRPETPEVIRKLLEPRELELLDIPSISDISDVFEEFHQDTFFNARKKGGKHISKYEADVITMNRFTEDFKNIMVETKNELQIEKNMINEDVETIEEI